MTKFIPLLIAVMLCGNCYAQTETEPNNVPAQANALSVPATSTGNTLGASGDVDWFKVTTTQAGVLLVNMPMNISPFKYSIEVYDNTTTGHVHTVDASSAGAAIDNEVVVPAGTWYIKVTRASFTTWNVNNSYSLNISMDISDSSEFNNLPADARVIPLNTQIHAKLRGYNYNGFGGRDKDYYKAIITKCGVMQVVIPTNNTGIRLDVDVKDSATNATVASKTASTAGGNIDFEFVAKPATYIIAVTRYLGAETSSDPYYLTVNYDTTDEGGCNNDFASSYAVQLCDTTIATIRPVGKFDFYKIKGNGKPFNISAIGVPANLTMRIVIRDKNNMVVTAYPTTPTQGSDVLITNYATVSGEDMYFEVQEMNNEKSSNPYKFIIRDADCDVTGIKDASKTVQLILSPNPSNGRFTVKATGANEAPMSVTITDLYGRRIKTLQGYTNKEMNISLDVPAGVYFLNVATAIGRQTEKIVIQ